MICVSIPLQCPDFDKEFFLQLDVSRVALGQREIGGEKYLKE